MLKASNALPWWSVLNGNWQVLVRQRGVQVPGFVPCSCLHARLAAESLPALLPVLGLGMSPVTGHILHCGTAVIFCLGKLAGPNLLVQSSLAAICGSLVQCSHDMAAAVLQTGHGGRLWSDDPSCLAIQANQAEGGSWGSRELVAAAAALQSTPQNTCCFWTFVIAFQHAQ